MGHHRHAIGQGRVQKLVILGPTVSVHSSLGKFLFLLVTYSSRPRPGYWQAVYATTISCCPEWHIRVTGGPV